MYDTLMQDVQSIINENAKLQLELEDEIKKSEYWETIATTLATLVADNLNVDVGEHTSSNCPVENAIEALKECNDEDLK